MTYTNPNSPYPYAQPKRKSRKGLWITLSVLAVLLCGGGTAVIAALASMGSEPSSVSPTWEAPAPSGQDATESAPKPPKAAGVTITAGTWAVGSEVKAGSYKTVAPEDEFIGCTWQRLKSDDGEFNSIITSDIIPPGTAGRLQIKKTDKFIALSGGCIWTPVK